MTLPFHESYLISSHHVLVRQAEEEKRWRWKNGSGGKYISWVQRFWSQIPFPSPTSAKDIHPLELILSSAINRLLREGLSLPFITALRWQYPKQPIISININLCYNMTNTKTTLKCLHPFFFLLNREHLQTCYQHACPLTVDYILLMSSTQHDNNHFLGLP